MDLSPNWSFALLTVAPWWTLAPVIGLADATPFAAPTNLNPAVL